VVETIFRIGTNASFPLLGLLGGLADIIIGAITELLKVLFSPIKGVIEDNVAALTEAIVQTPHPDAVFGAPTNGPWPAIYGYYWETVVPLSLGLYGLAIGLVILLESTSHLFSNYHRTKLKKRAFSGLLGILSWWWIAALSLRFMDALAIAFLPTLSEISLFETLSFGAMGAIGLVITMMADLILFLLIGLIYLVRHLVLYLFVLMMPILIVLWIPGVGPFTLASRFMKKLAGFYVPFLFMSIPVALLFRLGELLGHSFGLSESGIGAWLMALVIPFAALMSPFVLFWQAGALLFMADRAASHASAERASRRYSGGKETASQAHQGGRNFGRGVRTEPGVRSDGQTTLQSGDSRAHAAGRRVRDAGSRLSGTFLEDTGSNGGDSRSGGGSSGSDGGKSRSGETDRETTEEPRSSGEESADEDNQNDSAESSETQSRPDSLRDADRQDRDQTRIDDDPRYLQ